MRSTSLSKAWIGMVVSLGLVIFIKLSINLVIAANSTKYDEDLTALHTEKWLHWKYSQSKLDHTHRIQDSVVSRLVADLGDSKALFPEKLIRVDELTAANYNFYWAWTNDPCGGLQDNKWRENNGREFINDMVNDYKRLRSNSIIRPNGVSIDIGAHYGDTTIPMALMSNITLAFDPSDLVYPVLKANAQINPHLNIHTFNVGIAQKDGEVTFSYGADQCNGGVDLNSFTSVGGKGTHFLKKVVHLESFIRTHFGKSALQNIAYIKIDTEGYDHMILDSIHDLLNAQTTHQRPVIQIEYFQPYRVASIRLGVPQAVNDDTVKIFRAIEALPGNYSAYCTSQSKLIELTGKKLSWGLGSRPLPTATKPAQQQQLSKNSRSLYLIKKQSNSLSKAKRTGPHFYVQQEDGSDIYDCKDIMLLPVGHKGASRPLID